MAVMAHGEADLEDLRENLTCDLNVLLGDLKGLGYDQSQIPAFLNETRAQPLNIQIAKLRKQIARMQRIKDSFHQNSTSALSLASAPSEDSSTKKLKHAHPNQVQSAALDHHKPPIRMRPAVAVAELHEHSARVTQHGT